MTICSVKNAKGENTKGIFALDTTKKKEARITSNHLEENLPNRDSRARFHLDGGLTHNKVLKEVAEEC